MDNQCGGEGKESYNPYHPGYKFNSEVLFKIHLIVIIAFIVLAFVAPLGAIILVAFHRALFIYNRGCIINQLERKVCGNPQYDFFQELGYRLSGRHIGKSGSKRFDVILIASILVIAVLAFIYRRSRQNTKTSSLGIKRF